LGLFDFDDQIRAAPNLLRTGQYLCTGMLVFQVRNRAAFAGSGFDQDPVTVTELAPATPNPAARHAVLRYSLASRGPVDLSVYSVDGRRVKTIMHATQEAGRYRFPWNGTDDQGNLARAGIYFVRLNAGNAHFTRRLVLAGN